MFPSKIDPSSRTSVRLLMKLWQILECRAPEIHLPIMYAYRGVYFSSSSFQLLCSTFSPVPLSLHLGLLFSTPSLLRRIASQCTTPVTSCKSAAFFSKNDPRGDYALKYHWSMNYKSQAGNTLILKLPVLNFESINFSI